MGVSPIDTVLGRRGGVLRLVLELVCGMLTTQDRNNFVLVCQLWREVGEEPRFCYMGILSLTRENLNTIPERLDCRRMRFVSELRVEVGVKVSEEVLQAVARHQGLKKLVMNKIDLSTVEKGLIATVVGNLEAVEISQTQLTVQQLEAIITAIGAGDCLVKRLDISGNNLSTVCHSLLASAVNMIEEVNLSGTDLTVQQMEAIMTAIVDGDCLVTSLDISGNNLSTVNPGLMALAVNSLESISMIARDVTKQHVEAILTHSLAKTSLKCLSLIVSDPFFILDEDLMAKAHLAIRDFNIYNFFYMIQDLNHI